MEENNASQPTQNLENPVPAATSTPNVQSSPQNPSPQPANPMNSMQAAPQATLEKAGFIIRGAANIIDSLLIILIVFPLAILFPNFTENDSDTVMGLVFFAYFTLATGLYGTTLGKRYFYLKVTTVKGGKVGLGRAFLREVVGKILSSLIFSLGYFWVIWDKEKQGWHDKIAKTYVVSERPLGKGRKRFAFIIFFILPVLGILGVLAVIVLTAINPKVQLERARQQQEEMELRQKELQQEMEYIEQGQVQYN